MSASLDSITINGFKSYRRASLALAPLTLLVGANASGKSNAIEAIRFLHLLARGKRPDEIWQEAQDVELTIRGSRDALFHPALERIGLGCKCRDDAGDPMDLDLTLWVRGDGSLRLAEEKLSRKGTWLYEVDRGEGFSLLVRYNNFRGGFNKPLLTCTDEQPIFVQIQSASQLPPKYKKAAELIPSSTRSVREALERVQFLNSVPTAMRGYSFPAESRLRENGGNFSAILWNLCQDAAIKAKALGFVRSLPEQDILDIDFLIGPRGERMVQLVESFGGTARKQEAALLSDGTLRTLAVAAALLSAPEGSLLVIEELDNGIHPSRAHRLIEQMEALARERNLRVLLTTHNPALVDALPLSAVPNIVLCYRDSATGESRLARLDELPDYPRLVSQSSVGQLMTQGQLELSAKELPHAAEKRTEAKQWLEQFLKDGQK